MTDTVEIPMVTSLEDIQELLRREDNLLTVARPIELPRVPGDGSPHWALICAGPEAAVLLNLLMDYTDALVTQSKERAALAASGPKH